MRKNIWLYKRSWGLLVLGMTLGMGWLFSCGHIGDSNYIDENDDSKVSNLPLPSYHLPNTQTCTYDAEARTLTCAEKTYKTMRKDGEIWMTENLDIGMQVTDGGEQDDDTQLEKYCPGDKAENCASQGALYQWAEAMALPYICNSMDCLKAIGAYPYQGICPQGWHMPLPDCWDTLVNDLGGASVAGKKMKYAHTGNYEWDAGRHNDGNSSGFSALPVGSRNADGNAGYKGYALFWQIDEKKSSFASTQMLKASSDALLQEDIPKRTAIAVRCAKNELN